MDGECPSSPYLVNGSANYLASFVLLIGAVTEVGAGFSAGLDWIGLTGIKSGPFWPHALSKAMLPATTN